MRIINPKIYLRPVEVRKFPFVAMARMSSIADVLVESTATHLRPYDMFDVGFERYLIRLRLTRPTRFHFNHGGVLMGLMCRAFGTHNLPPGIVPFACESGGVSFDRDDIYHIGLTVAGNAGKIFDTSRLHSSLSLIGGRAIDGDVPRPTLAGNFEVIALEHLPQPDIAGEFERLQGLEQLTLRFLSPLRIERPDALRVKGAGFLNQDCFLPDLFLERLIFRLFLLSRGRYPDQLERQELLESLLDTDSVSAIRKNLLWIDLPLEGGTEKRDTRPKGYTTGGVLGEVALACVPDDWLVPLILGQYLHAGEKTHYGLGRYQISESGMAQSNAFRPARNYFERLLDPALLQESLAYVMSHSKARGVDGFAPEDYAGVEDSCAEQLGSALQSGSYQPAPLLGFVAPKKGGRLRPLVVPTVRDRAAQRAACELLGPAVDALLEDCSYAYRKGFSRAGAARAVERAYDDGYRYVLDADIESFFDAVDWERLFAKLRALFPFEPLMALIEGWVKSPVSFEGTTISRERGLPRGIAVAPLLANLFLDELDEELLGRDYRLVRYGDDFVVLCRDLEIARAAREDVCRKLSEVGLAISEEKTSIRTFDEGFDYLGYLFCRALVLERKAGENTSGGNITPDAIPRLSWLAQVPFERVRSLVRGRRGMDDRGIDSAGVKIVPLKAVKEASVPLVPRTSQAVVTVKTEATRPLYVTTFDTTVRRDGDSLIVGAPGGQVRTFPLRALSHVVCFGGVRITVPVLLALSEHGVPTYFCRRSGELKGVFGPQPGEWSLWMMQARAASDEEGRVRFAREVVAAKLHNFAALSVRFKLVRSAEVADELRALERESVNKTTTEALNGLEGRGAALYFGAVRDSLGPEWNFTGRRTQPPPDPVNAMLSFGYTLLYNHISTALVIAGLNPRVGLYHHERGAYNALACDLQEEFRHLVDSQVWAMINRREVKPADFYASEDGRYPSLMSIELRRKFIANFERRLATEFTPPGGEAVSYREHLEAQARQIKSVVSGVVTTYRPLRTRGKSEEGSA